MPVPRGGISAHTCLLQLLLDLTAGAGLQSAGAGIQIMAQKSAFWFATLALFLLNAGANLPTPLYEFYRVHFALTPFTVTAIYSVYALVVIAGLPVFGHASDRIGRRPVLVCGLLAATAGALTFAAAFSVESLFAARLIQGIAVGATTGSATAAVVELEAAGNRQRAALAATAATASGGALGPLFGSVLATYGPWPERLPFCCYMVLTIVLAAAVARSPDIGALRPHGPKMPVAAGSEPRSWLGTAFFLACATAFTAFMVPAVFMSLAPSYVTAIIGISSPLIGGFIAFCLMGGSAVAQLTLRGIDPRWSMPVGVGLMAIGLVGFTIGIPENLFSLVVVSTALAGLGQGLAFVGSVATVNHIAPSTQRGFVTSLLFVAIYCGGGIPILGLGWGATLIGLAPALRIFTALVSASCLALLALLFVWAFGGGLRKRARAARELPSLMEE